MIPFRRFLLVTLLALLLVGFAAHSLPVSLCECGTPLEKADALNIDFCLVCQLQAGVRVQDVATSTALETMLSMNDQPFVDPWEYVRSVLRPPIV
jgi:hypothetical protein